MSASITRKGRALVLAALVLALTVPAAASAQRDREDGWLGVVLQDVTNSMAGALGLDRAEGVLVNSVQEDGPAAEAGLREGDVIVRFNRRAVENSSELAGLVRRTSPGKKVRLEIVRNGERETVEVQVAERPQEQKDLSVLERRMKRDAVRPAPNLRGDADAADRAHREAFEMFKHSSGGWLGVQLQDLGEQLGEHFGIDDGEGALIQEVVEDSPAEQAGLKAGDVIVRIGDEDVESAADVTEQMAATEPGERIELQVVRDRRRQTIEVTLGERQGLGEMPRAFRLPRLEGREAPHAFFFEREGVEDPALELDLQELRQELRELRRELRELQQEFRARR